MNKISEAIFTAHAARFADQEGLDAQVTPAPTRGEDVYLGALEACSRLGFIAPDAEVLAQAWLRQSERGVIGFDTWPTVPSDFGLTTESSQTSYMSFAPCPKELGLYAVLPDAEWVGRMARAGIPTVQLRFKSEDRSAIASEVCAAVKAVQSTDARLFINDHWREALESGAYGIHLGQEDLDALPLSDVEEMRSSGVRLGVSTHGYAEMLRAHRVRPSYLALGAVFPTTLKKMATAPQGLERLRAYADLMGSQYPLVAIGGIRAEDFASVKACGVGSIAVVRALVNAENPEEEAKRLINTVGSNLFEQ